MQNVSKCAKIVVTLARKIVKLNVLRVKKAITVVMYVKVHAKNVNVNAWKIAIWLAQRVNVTYINKRRIRWNIKKNVL